MKKLFAILLALMLAMGCCGASAESAKLTIHVNEDMVKLMTLGVEETEEMDVMLPLLNALSLVLQDDKDAARLNLCLADHAIGSFTMGMSGEKLALVSNLFPNYVLTVSEEEVQALLPQETSEALLSPDNLTELLAALGADAETISVIQDFMEHVTEETVDNAFERLMNIMAAYETLPEEGEFVVDNQTYTEKIEHAMPATALLTTAVDFVSSLAPGSLLEKKVKAMAAEGLDEMLYHSERSPFDVPYELTFYANAADTALCLDFKTQLDDRGTPLNVVLRFTGEENLLRTRIGIGGENIETLDMIQAVAVSGLSDEAIFVDLTLTSAQNGNQMTITSDIYNMGECMGISCAWQAEPEFSVQLQLCYPTTFTELITYSMTVSEEEEISLPPIDLTGKTEITLTQLKTGDPAVEQLLNDLAVNGANVLLSNAIEAMPEEIGALLQMLNQEAELY